MSETKRLVLIDGSGYVFRAFFALPPLTDPKGVPVGAVFGFCNMLFRLVQDMAGDQLVVVFDKGRASFRNQIYDAYKANRLEPPPELAPQFPLVREAAKAFGLPVIEADDYEADDLIATYARQAQEQGQEVIVVSSDKDLMQLIGRGVQMYDPMKQKAIDRAEVIARFGVGPELLRDVLALAGDTSDNVPGVPGIGVKTAAQLLQEFHSLDELLANAASIKQPKRRENLLAYAEQARLSRTLVTLCETAPLPVPLLELQVGPADYARLLEFARAHGFRSLAQRVEPLATVQTAAAPPGAAPAEAELSYQTLRDLGALDAFLERATAAGIVAIVCATTSPSVASAELVGVALASDAGEACYLPFGHRDEFGTLSAGQLVRDGSAGAPAPAPRGPGGAQGRPRAQVRARRAGALRSRDPAPGRCHAAVLRDRWRRPRSRPGRARPDASRPRCADLRVGLRQRQAADRLRSGAGRARHGLRRWLRRAHAPPAPPAQGAARGRAAHARL